VILKKYYLDEKTSRIADNQSLSGKDWYN
jgi:hypothetical protein